LTVQIFLDKNLSWHHYLLQASAAEMVVIISRYTILHFQTHSYANGVEKSVFMPRRTTYSCVINFAVYW